MKTSLPITRGCGAAVRRPGRFLPTPKPYMHRFRRTYLPSDDKAEGIHKTVFAPPSPDTCSTVVYGDAEVYAPVYQSGARVLTPMLRRHTVGKGWYGSFSCRREPLPANFSRPLSTRAARIAQPVRGTYHGEDYFELIDTIPDDIGSDFLDPAYDQQFVDLYIMYGCCSGQRINPTPWRVKCYPFRLLSMRHWPTARAPTPTASGRHRHRFTVYDGIMAVVSQPAYMDREPEIYGMGMCLAAILAAEDIQSRVDFVNGLDRLFDGNVVVGEVIGTAAAHQK